MKKYLFSGHAFFISTIIFYIYFIINSTVISFNQPNNEITPAKLVSKNSIYLKNRSIEVTDLEQGIKIGNILKETMLVNKGVGLAAPQIGVNQRVFCAYTGINKLEMIINPKIISKSKLKIVGTEQCLSLKGEEYTVERSYSIEVKYFNGEEIVHKKLSGVYAKIFQHEYEHLDGILISDKTITSDFPIRVVTN